MSDQRGSELPVKAKRIIAIVIAAGFLAIAPAAFAAYQVQPLRLLLWALAAATAGAAKVRFRQINSCYSLGFMVVLAAMTALSLTETAVIAVIAAVSQCYWRPLKAPSLVQVLFNACNFGISGAAGWCAIRIAGHWLPARVGIGAGLPVFFLLNSGLVAMILAALSNRSLVQVWRSSFAAVFPLYLSGTTPAVLISTGALDLSATPLVMLLFAPVVYIALRVSVPTNL